MSNLKNFIDYKTNCPLCCSNLNLHFISNNNKKIKQVDDFYQITLEINGFPAQVYKKRFTINFNIGIESNDFYIDFINIDGENLDFIPKTNINDCINNIAYKGFQIYKSCQACKNYNYSSEYLVLDFNNAKIKEFFVQTESIKLKTIKVNYELVNNFIDKKSFIFYGTPQIKNNSDKYANILETSLIKISDYSKLIEKLETLICFS